MTAPDVDVDVVEWAPYLLLGADRAVIYVGITNRDPFERWREHRRKQPWGMEIIGCEAVQERYPTLKLALAREAQLIAYYDPKYNGTHRGGGRNYRGLDQPHPVSVRRDGRRSGGVVRRVSVRRRPWPRWKVRAVVACVVWLVLAIAIRIAVAGQVPARTGWWLSAVAPTAAMVLARVDASRRRRRH